MIIAHLTSAHPRFDIRIYHMMCRSLRKLGDVHLICADGLGDQNIDGINIIDVGKSSNRFSRMWFSVNKIYQKTNLIDADIYHIHDPELIRIGYKLIKKGKKVIFDSHEDVGATILNKFYLNSTLRKLIYTIYNAYEKYMLKKFSAIIAPTLFIKKKFNQINPCTEKICNYPIIVELKTEYRKKEFEKFEVCYIGEISYLKGVKELIKALELTKNKVYLNLAGNFISEQYEKELKAEKGWRYVNYFGYIDDRIKIKEIHQKSIIGIVTLLPNYNDINSLPIKMFEYMESQLPVIASDFNYFKEIFSEIKCGINVNPKNPEDIAKAIDDLIDNPIKRKEMGNNGYKAIINKFNWSIEETKLLKLYKDLLK
jgi:glycosyltransferase involved in cell wall biosynthesis